MLKLLLGAVDFNPVVSPVLEILDAILWPAISLVGGVGLIYCIYLGLKLSKIDEQNSREKAKKDLIGAIIGFLLIFILIVGLKLLMPIMQNWARAYI